MWIIFYTRFPHHPITTEILRVRSRLTPGYIVNDVMIDRHKVILGIHRLLFHISIQIL